MGRKSLKTEIIENEYTDPRWKLIYFLCEEYGWDLVKVWGWLIAVGELGILDSQFQKILNVPSTEYKKILTKIAKTELVERVRYVRQKNQRGIKLDWSDVIDKYGKFARYALQSTNSAIFWNEKDFQVGQVPPEDQILPESNSSNYPKRPTRGNYPPEEYLIINIVGAISDAEVNEIKQEIAEILVEFSSFKELEPNDYGKLSELSKVGTEIATHAGASDRARAAMYLNKLLININKRSI